VGDVLPESRVILDLGRVALGAEVFVNTKMGGRVFLAPYTLDITLFVRSGRNQVEVVVANPLSDYYSQFRKLEGKPLNEGVDRPERKVSGPLGPVVITLVTHPRPPGTDQANSKSRVQLAAARDMPYPAQGHSA